MAEENKEIIVKVMEELTNGYWNSDEAIKYTSMLFPFSKPEQKIRDALKALSCKKDKDERFRAGQSTLKSESDLHGTLREVERLLEKTDSRYRKRSSESEGRDVRDMLMMLMANLMSQRGSVTVNLDVNAFIELFYRECESCPIREMCKEAFVVCTEYISATIKLIGIQESSDE